MNTTDYRAMLSAVEKAIEVCDAQIAAMDENHLRICEDLRRMRAELMRLIGADTSAPEAT